MPIPEPSEYEWAYAQRGITSPYTETVHVGSDTLTTVLVTVPGDRSPCHVLFIPEDLYGIRDWCEYGLYDGWEEVTDEFRSVEIDTDTERMFAEALERSGVADKQRAKTEEKGEE